MPYKIHVDPTPLHAGMGFEVRLEITPPDVMKAGDIYEIRELGGQPVVFDVGQVTVPAGAAGPVPLVFQSQAGFQAAATAQIAVANLAISSVPVAQTPLNVLAAAVASPALAGSPPGDPPAGSGAAPTGNRRRRRGGRGGRRTKQTTTPTTNWFGRGMAATAGWGTIIVTGLFFVAMTVGLVLLPFWAAGLIASHGTPNPAGSVADGSPISKNKPADAAPKGDAGNASPP